MSLPVIDQISSLFYGAFGSPVLVGLVMVFFVVMLLLLMRANLAVIMVVLIPLITGIVLNTANSNFVSTPTWIIPIMWLVMGFLFVGFIISWANR